MQRYLYSCLILILIFYSCSEEKKSKTAKIEIATSPKTEIKSVPVSRSLFEVLNCNPLKIEDLKIKDSIHTGFSLKARSNKEDIDSIHVSRNKFTYESILKIELVTYFLGSQYKDGSADVCTNDKMVNDTIRSYIKIGDEKMYIDQFFQTTFKQPYYYYNHYSDIYRLKKLQFIKDKYYIAFFPCYYFGAQSWNEYLPVLFEITSNKLSNTYIMPFYAIDEDPFQFMDYDKNGVPEWMGIDDYGLLKIFPIKPKKMEQIPNLMAYISSVDQQYDLKDTTHNWPCDLKAFSISNEK